jgi:ATP/maltotriose-dependent transcriptional regulator MalT
VSGSEAPEEAVGSLLLKYIKGNIGAAIELFESLTGSVEQAIAAADVDVASKVVTAVRLGKVMEDVEILKVRAPKDSLSDAMLEAISVLLRALVNLNAGRLDDVERELLGLQLTLGRTVDRLIEGCTRAQLGEAGPVRQR